MVHYLPEHYYAVAVVEDNGDVAVEVVEKAADPDDAVVVVGVESNVVVVVEVAVRVVDWVFAVVVEEVVVADADEVAVAVVDVADADEVGVAVVDVAAVFAGDSIVVVIDVELAVADGGGFVAVVVECFVVSVEV